MYKNIQNIKNLLEVDVVEILDLCEDLISTNKPLSTDHTQAIQKITVDNFKMKLNKILNSAIPTLEGEIDEAIEELKSENRKLRKEIDELE